MAKRRNKKKWLFEEYKEQHPELYGKQKKQLSFDSVSRVWWKIFPVVIFIFLNIITITLMMLLNEDIRSWILGII